MWPAEVPSDMDLEEVPDQELLGRLTILEDIRSEFQGSTSAYALIAFVAPGFLIVDKLFRLGFSERSETFAFFIFAAVFVSLVSIALYSFVWSRWASKRVRRIEELREKRFAAEEADEFK